MPVSASVLPSYTSSRNTLLFFVCESARARTLPCVCPSQRHLLRADALLPCVPWGSNLSADVVARCLPCRALSLALGISHSYQEGVTVFLLWGRASLSSSQRNSVVSLESGLLCKPLWALGAPNGCSSSIKGWEFCLYFRPFAST